MERLKVLYQQEARSDLSAIYKYIRDASQNAQVARSFTLRIRDRCKSIGDAPHGGRPRDDLEPGLRTVPFEKSAIIAYKVENDHVLITNVFYGGRDFEALYQDHASGD